MYADNDYRNYLQHHGILGMKWGVQNGPPYPLGASDHSASEKRAGWRKSLARAVIKGAIDGAKQIKEYQDCKKILKDYFKNEKYADPNPYPSGKHGEHMIYRSSGYSQVSSLQLDNYTMKDSVKDVKAKIKLFKKILHDDDTYYRIHGDIAKECEKRWKKIYGDKKINEMFPTVDFNRGGHEGSGITYLLTIKTPKEIEFRAEFDGNPVFGSADEMMKKYDPDNYGLAEGIYNVKKRKNSEYTALWLR